MGEGGNVFTQRPFLWSTKPAQVIRPRTARVMVPIAPSHYSSTPQQGMSITAAPVRNVASS